MTMQQPNSQSHSVIDIAIGSRLRTLRKSAGYTTQELAVSAQIPRSLYEEAEKGQFRLKAEQLFNVARALEVKMKDIMSAL